MVIGFVPASSALHGYNPDVIYDKKGESRIGALEVAQKQAYRTVNYDKPDNHDHDYRKALFHLYSIKR
jgi:hypothetical protein